MPGISITRLASGARTDDRSRSSVRGASPAARRWACIAVAISLHAGVLIGASAIFQQHYRYHPHQPSTVVSLTMPTGFETATAQKVDPHSDLPSKKSKRSEINPGPVHLRGNDIADDPTANLAPVDHYFTADEVTIRAYPLRPFRLTSNCLDDAQAELKLWINEKGTVDRIEALRTNLDEGCLRVAKVAFQLTPFASAKRGEDAVKSIWLVELTPKNDQVQ